MCEMSFTSLNMYTLHSCTASPRVKNCCLVFKVLKLKIRFPAITSCGLSSPDGLGRLGQRGQELPGGRAPHGHHLLEADGQQRAVGREAAALGRQAVIGSNEVTRPGRTFVCSRRPEAGGRRRSRGLDRTLSLTHTDT